MGAGLPAGRLSAGSYPQIKGRRQKDGGHWLLLHQAASHNTGWINLQQLLPGAHFSTFSLSISLFIHPLPTTVSSFTSTSISTLCPLFHYHLMSTYCLCQSAMNHLRSRYFVWPKFFSDDYIAQLLHLPFFSNSNLKQMERIQCTRTSNVSCE